MHIIFNYDRLKGKITEVCGTYGEFAKRMGVSSATMTSKIKGTSDFSHEEIFRAAKILGINSSDISQYFFNVKV